MTNTPHKASMLGRKPQRLPNAGLGGDGGTPESQLDLALPPTVREIAEYIEGIYKRCWEPAVEVAGGIMWLAASMGRPYPAVSLRVRHAPDSKGEIQKSTLDMVGHIASDRTAREVFLYGLCDEWEYDHPQRRHVPTAEEKREAMAVELSERRKREIEAAHGWPVGSLDR